MELGNKNPNLLKEALEALGFKVEFIRDGLRFSGVHAESGIYQSGTYINGQITHTGALEINSVKRAYSHRVIAKAAKTYNWKTTKTKKGYTAQKAY